MAFKIEGKEMYLSFVLTKCCWSVHSKVVRLGKHAHSKREKPLPHNLCSFLSCLGACPARSASIEFVFFQHMVWHGPTSETVWMQRRQNNWLKYTDFTELKKITIRVYSNCSNYSLFSSPSNFVAVCFVWFL